LGEELDCLAARHDALLLEGDVGVAEVAAAADDFDSGQSQKIIDNATVVLFVGGRAAENAGDLAGAAQSAEHGAVIADFLSPEIAGLMMNSFGQQPLFGAGDQLVVNVTADLVAAPAGARSAADASIAYLFQLFDKFLTAERLPGSFTLF